MCLLASYVSCLEKSVCLCFYGVIWFIVEFCELSIYMNTYLYDMYCDMHSVKINFQFNKIIFISEIIYFIVKIDYLFFWGVTPCCAQ